MTQKYFNVEPHNRAGYLFLSVVTAANDTRAFDGDIDTWTYAPMDDTAMVAAEVIRRLG